LGIKVSHCLFILGSSNQPITCDEDAAQWAILASQVSQFKCSETMSYAHYTLSSDEATLPVCKAHPMEITTDGSGTVFVGQTRRERLIVEIMDPGRKTIGSTSLAEMGVDEDAAVQEVGTVLLMVLVCAGF